MKKKVIFISCSLFIGLFIAFIIIEVVLRIIPNQWTYTTFKHVRDSKLGQANPHNAEHRHASLDYDNIIHTNKFGMRDKERTFLKKRYRIAVLGDSYVQALQVQDDNVFTRSMENSCDEIEVLNFGVMGYGTTQEFVQYQTTVKKFSPDMVVVMLYAANDIWDNSIELHSSANRSINDRPFFIYDENDQLKLKYPILRKKNLFSKISEIEPWLRRTSSTWHLLNYIEKKIKFLFSKKNNLEVDMLKATNDFRIKLKEDKLWMKGWQLTKSIIQKFAIEIKKDGKQFVLVNIPIEQIDTNAPPNMMTKVEMELKLLAKKNGFLFLPLTPYFLSYILENNINPPHFHFKHDGHWRPLGHRLVATVLLEYLKNQKIISSYNNPLKNYTVKIMH